MKRLQCDHAKCGKKAFWRVTCPGLGYNGIFCWRHMLVQLAAMKPEVKNTVRYLNITYWRPLPTEDNHLARRKR